jgi:hypothetical protein
MLNRWTVLVVAAVLTLGIASQASAQSFNPRDGSGNSLPLSYGPGGSRTQWSGAAPQSNPIAIPQIGSGLYNYAGPQANHVGHHGR